MTEKTRYVEIDGKKYEFTERTQCPLTCVDWTSDRNWYCTYPDHLPGEKKTTIRKFCSLWNGWGECPARIKETKEDD